MSRDEDDVLRAIVARHVPKDPDERYTSHFAGQWYRAVAEARRVILTDSSNGRLHASWVGEEGAQLLDLDGHPERLYPFVADWADWKARGGYGTCIDDRRVGSRDSG